MIISAEAVESAPGLFEPCSDVLVPRVTVSVSESAVRESPALKLRAHADEIIARRLCQKLVRIGSECISRSNCLSNVI